MKKRIIDYLESLGFETVSHETSSRLIFQNGKVTVTVEER